MLTPSSVLKNWQTANRKQQTCDLGKYHCPSNSGKWRLVKFSIHYFEFETRFQNNKHKSSRLYNDETMIFDSLHIQDSQQLFVPGFLLTLWCLAMVGGLQWTCPGDKSETVHVNLDHHSPSEKSPNPEVLNLRYSITWEFTHLYPSSIPESATYLLQFELFRDKSSKTQSSWHFNLHQKSSLSGAKDYVKGWFLINIMAVQWGRLSHSGQTTWLARKVQMLIMAYKSGLLSTHGGGTKYELLY